MNAFTFVIALVGMVFLFITFWIMLGITGSGGKRQRRRQERDGDDNHDLERLSAMADSLTERIEALESILDAEIPNWREHHEQAG